MCVEKTLPKSSPHASWEEGKVDRSDVGPLEPECLERGYMCSPPPCGCVMLGVCFLI